MEFEDGCQVEAREEFGGGNDSAGPHRVFSVMV